MGITDPKELENDYKPNRHPVLCLDPFSKKECLMISAHTRRIEGIEEKDQEALINELIRLVTAEPYTHKWQIGDLILWNNRRCLHRVLTYELGKERRRLYRVEIIGEKRPQSSASHPVWKKFYKNFLP